MTLQRVEINKQQSGGMICQIFQPGELAHNWDLNGALGILPTGFATKLNKTLLQRNCFK